MFDLRKANRWSLPRVSYCNFRKRFPQLGKDCMKQWVWFQRYWGSRVWTFGLLHHQITFDFRRSTIDDLAFPSTPAQDREAVKGAIKHVLKD